MTLALYIWWISMDKPPTSTPAASDLNSIQSVPAFGGSPFKVRHARLSWLQTFQGGVPMMKIAFVVAAAVLTTARSLLRPRPKASRWPKSICRQGCTSTTPPIIVGTVAGMTPTPQSASVQAVSPSAHDSAAAWRLPRLNGTMAAGSRAGSTSATKGRDKPASVNQRVHRPSSGCTH
jgi:hypothetical protein